MSQIKTILFTGLLLNSLCTFATVTEQIQVDDAYVREVPTGQQVSAAFMVLHNNDMDDHKIISATSPAAKTVELHTHSHENGMMKMRQVPNINIPAGGDALLKPGSFHIMLIGLTQDLSADKPVSVTLKFEDGSEKLLSLPVKSPMSNQ